MLSLNEKRKIADEATEHIVLTDKTPTGNDDITEMVDILKNSRGNGTTGQPQEPPSQFVGVKDEAGQTIEGETIPEEPPLPPISPIVLKGLLVMCYKLPALFYRVRDFVIPEDVMLDIDMQAEQLHAIMTRYGVVNIKYLDVMVFGVSMTQNMIGIVGICKDKKALQVAHDRAIELENIRIQDEIRRHEETKNPVQNLAKDDMLMAGEI